MPPAADTQVALLEVPLIELANDDLAIVAPFGPSIASRFGIEVYITITGTELQLVTTYIEPRVFRVLLTGVADAAIRALDAHLKAEALSDGEGEA